MTVGKETYMPRKPIRYEYWTTLICIAYAIRCQHRKSIHSLLNDEYQPQNSFNVKRRRKRQQEEKNRWRDFFLLICLRFGIVNFYIATEQAKYILYGTEKKSEHNFSVGILILFTLINWRETWMPENVWRKKWDSLVFFPWKWFFTSHELELIKEKWATATTKKEWRKEEFARD